MTSVALADELLLLAYDDETGRCAVSVIALDLGMAAAVLVDLVLHGRIEVTNRAVLPVDPSPTGHAVVDEILGRICAEQPQPAARWLQRLRHNLRQHVLESLIAQGVVRDQDVTAWDVLRVHRYPMVDPTAERETRSRLAAALTGGAVPDERTAALATLVAAVRMEPTLGLTGEAVAKTHQRLEEIAEGAGFAGTAVQTSTVRPSVAFLIGELTRVVHSALGPARSAEPR
jgi:Golgi phosphoprotein 3 (GPP34)